MAKGLDCWTPVVLLPNAPKVEVFPPKVFEAPKVVLAACEPKLKLPVPKKPVPVGKMLEALGLLLVMWRREKGRLEIQY